MPGVGAAAACAQIGAVECGVGASSDTGSLYRRDEQRAVARRRILSLRQAEADALAVDFNRVWNDAGIRLLAAGQAPTSIAS